jgi:hypothetical protein
LGEDKATQYGDAGTKYVGRSQDRSVNIYVGTSLHGLKAVFYRSFHAERGS